MIQLLLPAILLAVLATTAAAAPYVPPAGGWAWSTPAEAGFAPERLAGAVELAIEPAAARSGAE